MLRIKWRFKRLILLKWHIMTEVLECFIGQFKVGLDILFLFSQYAHIITHVFGQHLHLYLESNSLGLDWPPYLCVLLSKLFEIKLPLIQFYSWLIKVDIKVFLIHFKCILMIEYGIEGVDYSNSGYWRRNDLILETWSVTISGVHCCLDEFYIQVGRLTYCQTGLL